jgi:hypothetical protein
MRQLEEKCGRYLAQVKVMNGKERKATYGQI